MTRRMWGWVATLSVLAAIDLSATIRAHVQWHPPAGSQASLTLPQLLGFASSGVLIIAVALILITGWRSWRQRQRLAAWQAQADRQAQGGRPGTRYVDLGDPE